MILYDVHYIKDDFKERNKEYVSKFDILADYFIGKFILCN